jgi:hypothetical protein
VLDFEVAAPKMVATVVVVSALTFGATTATEIRVPNEPLLGVGGLGYSSQLRIPTLASYTTTSTRLGKTAELSASTAGTEALMSELKTAGLPWSERLLDLDAASRVTGFGLQALMDILKRSDVEHWPLAGVFPGEDGGLRIEWRANSQHTVFEVDDEDVLFAAHFNFTDNTEDDLETARPSEAVTFLNDHLHA